MKNKKIPVIILISSVTLITVLWIFFGIGEKISDIILVKKSKIMNDKLSKVEKETDSIAKMIKEKMIKK
ncbi:hypothetical protein H311_02914 [Anncaliia algerae PRA109]|nr:hypothetical protein H311_02914 [Anncaliia algerae PRA109]